MAGVIGTGSRPAGSVRRTREGQRAGVRTDSYHRAMPLNDFERRVCRSIAAMDEPMRAELAAHVAIPTGQNFEPGLNEYRALVVERLRKLGASIEFVPGSPRPPWLELPAQKSSGSVPPVVVARRASASPAGQRLLIVGHLDTVHDPHGTFRTLRMAPDGQAATGPGAVDMKGGIVIALAALEVLAERGLELNWTFLLNSDEETGSIHSFGALQKSAREHDVGIVLEPALPDGSLVVERMGAGQFKVEVFGRAAHVGREFERGVSAVNTLAELLLRLSRLSQPQQGLIVNVGPLQGGAVTNAVPEYAACWGNARFKSAEAARALEQQIMSLATAGDAMPRVAAHCLFNRPAKPLIPPVEVLAEMARSAAEDLGQELPFASTGGVCDGNILQDAGLPTIDTLGVRGGNLHRSDEFIELASLVERAQLLAVVLSRLAAGQVVRAGQGSR